MKKSTTLKKAQAGGSKSSYKTTNEVYTNALLKMNMRLGYINK